MVVLSSFEYQLMRRPGLFALATLYFKRYSACSFGWWLVLICSTAAWLLRKVLVFDKRDEQGDCR
jgi:hypothetical protein